MATSSETQILLICPTFYLVVLYVLNIFKDYLIKKIHYYDLSRTSQFLHPQSCLLYKFVPFPEIDLKTRKNGREYEFASSLLIVCLYLYGINFLKTAACLHQVNHFMGRTELLYT